YHRGSSCRRQSLWWKLWSGPKSSRRRPARTQARRTSTACSLRRIQEARQNEYDFESLASWADSPVEEGATRRAGLDEFDQSAGGRDHAAHVGPSDRIARTLDVVGEAWDAGEA